MPRQVFHTFDFDRDAWRAAQVRAIGAVQGQPILRSNEWEDVAQGGDPAIKAWIDEQMRGKSCDVVLIGSRTAGRRWIEYEFRKAWSDRRGVVGVHVHRLLDRLQKQDTKGANPFSRFQIDTPTGKVDLDRVVPVYDPPYAASKDVYACIAENLEEWVEEGIRVRSRW
jgi:hypothetical protein